MDKHQNYADYADSMNNARRKKSREKLRAVALHFQSTLQRLPALKQELDAMLQSTEALDYEELLKRVEPVLQQASDWLWDVDNLPRDLADDAEMKKFTADVCARLALANAARLIPSFYNFQHKVMEGRKYVEREKAEAERRTEKGIKQAAEKEAQVEKFRAINLHYHSTLQRLPTLKLELDMMLQSTDGVDYKELLKRVEPVLQLVNDWLWDVDTLPDVLADDAEMKKLTVDVCARLGLVNAARLISSFYSFQHKMMENKENAEKEKAKTIHWVEEVTRLANKKKEQYRNEEAKQLKHKSLWDEMEEKLAIKQGEQHKSKEKVLQEQSKLWGEVELRLTANLLSQKKTL